MIVELCYTDRVVYLLGHMANTLRGSCADVRAIPAFIGRVGG